jgi:Icc protein
MLIAQLSDVHVGGSRYREELLRTAIEEVNNSEPDLAVIAGDLTDDGYPDQYPLAARELAALRCPRIVRVPGNHDARNVGYLRYEDAFGARDSRLRLDCSGMEWRWSRSTSLIAIQ